MQTTKKKRCIIFGGGGFIGSHLAEELINSGYIVRIFEIKNFNKSNISHLLDSVEIIEGDFNNKVDIKLSLHKVDYVFHLISSTTPSVSMANPLFDIETNLISSVNLLQECINIKTIQKLVFISSGGTVYGIPQEIPITEKHPTNPISSYGIIKNTIEHYCNLYDKLYGLKSIIFRLSNPYGERQNPFGKQGVVPIFLNKILSHHDIEIWGDGEVIRDYIYIKDVTNLLAKSLEIETVNSTYNIGSGHGLSLNQLLLIMGEITNLDAKIKYFKARSFDVPCNILDITQAKNDFSWEPKMDIHEGMSIVNSYLLKTYFNALNEK